MDGRPSDRRHQRVHEVWILENGSIRLVLVLLDPSGIDQCFSGGDCRDYWTVVRDWGEESHIWQGDEG
jgi:hypothetical protein